MKYDYSVDVKLYHNEIPAKVNLDTGEVKQFTKRKNNIPADSQIFQPKSIFKKMYPNTWNFLRKYLNGKEIEVVQHLVLKAKMNTNSLSPLSDDSTIPELMREFGISKNTVQPILKKLYLLGIYGKFEVALPDKPYTKYWVLNPYLAFSGTLIKDNIVELFNGTHCMKAHMRADYELTPKEIKEYKIKSSKLK